MSKKGDIAELVRLIVDGVKRHGFANIQRQLKGVESFESASGKPKAGRHHLIKDRILREISDVYGIAPRTIISSKERGNTTQAKVTAIILFHLHLGLTQKKIAQLLGYDPPIVSARIGVLKKITCDEAGMPLYESQRRFEKVYDKNFMKNFSIINTRVTEYING